MTLAVNHTITMGANVNPTLLVPKRWPANSSTRIAQVTPTIVPASQAACHTIDMASRVHVRHERQTTIPEAILAMMHLPCVQQCALQTMQGHELSSTCCTMCLEALSKEAKRPNNPYVVFI